MSEPLNQSPEDAITVPNFDVTFQRCLLKLALKDDHFASQLTRYICDDLDVKKVEIFNNQQLQVIFRQIVDSVHKYQTRPSEATIRQFFLNEFENDERDIFSTALDTVLAADTHDEVHIRTYLRAFVQQIKIANGFNMVRNLWKDKKRMDVPDVMQSVVDGIRRVNFEREDLISLEEMPALIEASKVDTTNIIPTGIAELDDDLLGGLPTQALCIVLGGTNVGKSLFCISLAANALKTGKKVLYINLEGRRDSAPKRLLSNLSTIPYGAIARAELTTQQSAHIQKLATAYGRDKLVIRNMLGFGVTVEEVMSVAKEIKKDFDFHMIVVDYGQILGTRMPTEGLRHTQATVFRGLDSLAKELNVALISPAQATRDGQRDQNTNRKKKEDKLPVLRSTDISEAFEICRVAETILSLNRSEDEEKRSRLRVYLEKSRAGEKGKTYHLVTDYPSCNLITGQTFEPESMSDVSNEMEDSGEISLTGIRPSVPLGHQNAMKPPQTGVTQDGLNNMISKYDSICSAITALRDQTKDLPLDNEAALREIGGLIVAKRTERDNLLKSIKTAVKIVIPSAGPELYELQKKSIKDMELNSSAPKKSFDEARQVLRALELYVK